MNDDVFMTVIAKNKHRMWLYFKPKYTFNTLISDSVADVYPEIPETWKDAIFIGKGPTV